MTMLARKTAEPEAPVNDPISVVLPVGAFTFPEFNVEMSVLSAAPPRDVIVCVVTMTKLMPVGSDTYSGL